MPKLTIAHVIWNAQDAIYQVQEKVAPETSIPVMDFTSASWQEWLERVPSFAFQSKDGHRFTARKEARAHRGAYWVAYRKAGGKLTHSYLGRSEAVTLSRLEQVARFLAGQDCQQAVAPRLIEGDSVQEQQVRPASSNTLAWQDQYLATKFFVPVAPHVLVRRLRLFSLLEEGRQRPLTLVSAPAGFGKTTLLAAWVQAQPPGNPLVAWVSLDEQDNDPVRFWSYVLTALDRIQPGTYRELARYLRAAERPSLPSVITACLNCLAEHSAPLILVLDDYHLITEPEVHTFLTSFLEHLPAHVRVLLSTRADPPLPLTRLRGRGHLLEVRADQLRTTPGEAMAFLREVMHVDLTEHELAAVEKRTEGWLVGLQLVGLSLQGRPSFTSSRDLLEEISGQQGYILDYLTEEVLNHQEPAVQHFLLHTSILERLTAPLCDVVTGKADSQQMLETLERANLFLVPLDSQRHWYRYHALFAEALRSRLEQWKGEQMAALHLRASYWYAAHGSIGAAVEHALLAQDWEQAATLIEHAISPVLWKRSEFPLVLRWLERLPPAVIRSRPRLCFTYAWVLHCVSSADALWLEAAEAGLAQQQVASAALGASEQANLDDLRGQFCILRARMAILEGDGQKIHGLCEWALAHLSPANRLARVEVLILQTVADFQLGDLVPATEKALEVAALAQQVESVPQVLVQLGHVMRCLYRRGQCHEALRMAQRADQVGRMPGGLHSPMMSVVFLYQALVLLEWKQLDEALDLAHQAIELGEHTGLVLYEYMAYTILLEIQLARGDLEAAASAQWQAEHLLVAHLQDSWFFRALYLTGPQVRFWLRRGERERASYELETQVHRRDKPPASLARAMEVSALVRLRLVQGKAQEALTLLAPTLEEAMDRHWGKLVIELLILQALARQMRQEEQAAINTLAQAVHLAEPEGYIRSFVDEGAPMAALLATLRERKRKQGPTPYLDRVLAAFSLQTEAGQRTAQHALLDPLSPREQEVLQLLAGGASNQEIAETLVITLDTVKHHVSSILSKPGVSNRTQAVTQARSLGML